MPNESLITFLVESVKRIELRSFRHDKNLGLLFICVSNIQSPESFLFPQPMIADVVLRCQY